MEARKSRVLDEIEAARWIEDGMTIAVGAPAPLGPPAAPAELAVSFAIASLAAAAAFWVFLGGLSGYLFRRFTP